MLSSKKKFALVASGMLFLGGAIALTMGCVLAITPLIVGGVIVLMAGSLGGMMSCINARF